MLSGTGTPWKSKLCSHSLGHSSIVFVMSLMMIMITIMVIADIVLLYCVRHIIDHDHNDGYVMVIADILLLDFVSIVDCTHPFISNQC